MFSREITTSLVTYENPHGTISNSDLELAGHVAHNDVLASLENIDSVTYQRLQQSGLSHSLVAGIYVGVTMAIAVLILNYDTVGAIVGSIGTLGLIAIGELYLRQLSSEIRSNQGNF